MRGSKSISKISVAMISLMREGWSKSSKKAKNCRKWGRWGLILRFEWTPWWLCGGGVGDLEGSKVISAIVKTNCDGARFRVGF